MPSCKKFCEDVFVPEKERVEQLFSKNYKVNKSFDLKPLYMRACDKVYCQKSCSKKNRKNRKNGKNEKRWVKSYTKKRKSDLMKKGALSGCRDLVKEFPKYYKGI
jgi:hypothetical protein